MIIYVRICAGWLSEFVAQKIENLEALVNLEELWLGKNKIAKIEVREMKK